MVSRAIQPPTTYIHTDYRPNLSSCIIDKVQVVLEPVKTSFLEWTDFVMFDKSKQIKRDAVVYSRVYRNALNSFYRNSHPTVQ